MKAPSNKLVLIISLILVLVYTGLPRMMSVSSGLPYHVYWDEPQSASYALVDMKTNNFFPNGNSMVYGGAMRYPLMLIDFIYYRYLRLVSEDVESKEDIKTYLEGFYKTTSDSGFYLLNRIFIVLVNLLGFVFLFLICRLRSGYMMAFLSVILLSSIYAYYERSFLLNVDVPLSTWMLGTLYFALRFDKTKSKKFFTLSLICAGLGAATKYTGASLCLIPLIAGLLNYRVWEWKSKKEIMLTLLKWGGISFGTFVILNPVTIFHPNRLYNMIIWLSEVYSQGQGHFTKEPGLEHVNYQFNMLVGNLGATFFILSMIGLVLGLSKLFIKSNWQSNNNSGFVIISAFPIIYFFYVTLFYTIAYHRNFMLIYPVLAYLAAEAIVFGTNYIKNQIQLNYIRNLVSILIIGIFFYLSFNGYKRVFKVASNLYTGVETRTKAVYEINKMHDKGEKIFLGINEDFLYSPVDVNKLKSEYSYFKINNLGHALTGFTHLLIPEYSDNLMINNFDSLNQKIIAISEENRILKIPGNKLYIPDHYSELEYPINNPTINIIKGSEFPPDNMDQFSRPLEHVNNITLISNEPVKLISTKVNPGNYFLRFEARGDSAIGIFPIIKIFIDQDTLKTIRTTNEYITDSVTFQIEVPRRIQIKARMINDLYDPDKNLDRNAVLKSIELRKD